MRVAVCLLLAALNALLAAAFSAVAFGADTSIPLRLGFGVTAFAVLVAAGMLAVRPFVQLPAVSVAIFRGWCIALPGLYFIASLDRDMLSGQEFLLGLFVAGFSWATWRAFIWVRPSSQATEQANA
jgi:hypothetical protein